MAKTEHGARGALKGPGAGMSNAPVSRRTAEDNVRVVDQAKVTSTVSVKGKITTRRYSDGAVQRQEHATAQHAKDYAVSVREQEG